MGPRNTLEIRPQPSARLQKNSSKRHRRRQASSTPACFGAWQSSVRSQLARLNKLEIEPLFLTREQIDTIHQEQLNAWGGISGLRNENGLESAIAQPPNVYVYGGGDLYEIAAAYAYHLAESQAYLDGNNAQPFRPH